MGPRWKGKGSETKALSEAMSKIVSQLQSSLTMSDHKGLISGCSVLLEAGQEQSQLLNQACFGRPFVTSQKDKQWYELALEEAFYLCFELKCLKIVGHDGILKSDMELWHYTSSKVEMFPEVYKAYSHLRMKNWVVRSGSQYGVDYVTYRHHPALVHSEYAVIIISDRIGNPNGRLRLWSDLYCAIRLSGGVAKTLMALHIKCNGFTETVSPLCLKNYGIEERTITRWIPEQSREEREDVNSRTLLSSVKTDQGNSSSPSTECCGNLDNRDGLGSNVEENTHVFVDKEEDSQSSHIEKRDVEEDEVLPTPVHGGNDEPKYTLGSREADDRGNKILEIMGLKLVDSVGKSISLGSHVDSKHNLKSGMNYESGGLEDGGIRVGNDLA